MEQSKEINVYNLILLDESGSMSSIWRQALDGINETLNGIRKTQDEYPSQHQYVSIVTFEGNGVRGVKTLRDRIPVENIQNLKDDEVASLHIFTVTPEYQGKGVSKRMMAEIISLAMKKGKKAIRLDTLASNIPAQHMYEKLGFAYRGKLNLYAENTGWTDFLYYELPLIP